MMKGAVDSGRAKVYATPVAFDVTVTICKRLSHHRVIDETGCAATVLNICTGYAIGIEVAIKNNAIVRDKFPLCSDPTIG